MTKSVHLEYLRHFKIKKETTIRHALKDSNYLMIQKSLFKLVKNAKYKVSQQIRLSKKTLNVALMRKETNFVILKRDLIVSIRDI